MSKKVNDLKKVEEKPLYEVEYFVDSRISKEYKNEKQILVKWKGYKYSENTCKFKIVIYT